MKTTIRCSLNLIPSPTYGDIQVRWFIDASAMYLPSVDDVESISIDAVHNQHLGYDGNPAHSIFTDLQPNSVQANGEALTYLKSQLPQRPDWMERITHEIRAKAQQELSRRERSFAA